MTGDSNNYFGVEGIGELYAAGQAAAGPNMSLPASITVSQAYAIDKKVDDGSPLTGNVTTMGLYGGPTWVGASPGTATAGSATTCYDNGGNASAAMQYSLAQNSSAGRLSVVIPISVREPVVSLAVNTRWACPSVLSPRQRVVVLGLRQRLAFDFDAGDAGCVVRRSDPLARVKLHQPLDFVPRVAYGERS